MKYIKDIVIIWFGIQVFMIGAGIAGINNSFVDGTFNCSELEEVRVNKLRAGFYGLTAFIPAGLREAITERGEEYCNEESLNLE